MESDSDNANDGPKHHTYLMDSKSSSIVGKSFPAMFSVIASPVYQQNTPLSQVHRVPGIASPLLLSALDLRELQQSVPLSPNVVPRQQLSCASFGELFYNNAMQVIKKHEAVESWEPMREKLSTAIARAKMHRRFQEHTQVVADSQCEGASASYHAMAKMRIAFNHYIDTSIKGNASYSMPRVTLADDNTRLGRYEEQLTYHGYLHVMDVEDETWDEYLYKIFPHTPPGLFKEESKATLSYHRRTLLTVPPNEVEYTPNMIGTVATMSPAHVKFQKAMKNPGQLYILVRAPKEFMSGA